MKARQFSRWTEEEKNVIKKQIRNNVIPTKAIKAAATELRTRSYNSVLAMYYTLRMELSKETSEETITSPVIKTIETNNSSTNSTTSPFVKVEFNKDCVTVYFPTI